MDSYEVSIQARFDRINAGHRDALAAFKRFAYGLALLTEDEQNQIVKEMTPMERALMGMLATDEGNKRLAKLFGETSE